MKNSIVNTVLIRKTKIVNTIFFLYIYKYIIHNNNGDIMDLKLILEVSYRALISILSLFLVTKMLGKKQVSELSLFDYVVGISIGNFAAEMTYNTDSNELVGVLAVIMFGLVAYFVSMLTMKSLTLRRFFIGAPTIIIQEGKILRNNMKKVRIDVNDLLEECRIKGYFDISQIQYGIMEVNGEMSFLPKSNYKNVQLNDLNIKATQDSILANVIIDGKILSENLKYINKNKEWLLHELKVKGYSDLNKILLCTISKDEKVTVYLDNDIKSIDVLE